MHFHFSFKVQNKPPSIIFLSIDSSTCRSSLMRSSLKCTITSERNLGIVSPTAAFSKIYFLEYKMKTGSVKPTFNFIGQFIQYFKMKSAIHTFHYHHDEYYCHVHLCPWEWTLLRGKMVHQHQKPWLASYPRYGQVAVRILSQVWASSCQNLIPGMGK